VSLTRERFNVRANWNYRSEQRLGRIAAGASIGPSTYTWSPSRLYLDVSGEFNLTTRLALFAALRNVTDQSDARDIYGPTTPASARFRQSVAYASLWTFGFKGQF
jgi:outer membrane receptor for ferrienterochelin and colicin